MQDVPQTPAPDPNSPTTVDPTLHEPGMDAMSPAAGNPSSDAGGDPADTTATSATGGATQSATDNEDGNE
jgi:hypothetical protein